MTAPAQPTRMVFGDQLRPGMVMVRVCVGPYCYPRGLVHEAESDHLLQVLDLRVDGEQHSWSTRSASAVRVLVTVPEAATTEVTP